MRKLLGRETEASEAYGRIARMREELSVLGIYEIIKKGMHEFLDQIQSRIIEINGSIYAEFFSLSPAQPVNILEGSGTNA